MEQKSLFTYFLECITKNYFNFEGRARRRECWGFFLFFFLLSIVFVFLTIIMLISTFPRGASTQSLTPIVEWIAANSILWLAFLILYLLMLIPTWAVQTRRLHDRGMSGWWLVGSFALGMLYNIVFYTGDNPILKFVVGWASTSLGIYLLVQMILDGERGANKYGPNPKYPEGMYY